MTSRHGSCSNARRDKITYYLGTIMTPDPGQLNGFHIAASRTRKLRYSWPGGRCYQQSDCKLNHQLRSRQWRFARTASIGSFSKGWDRRPWITNRVKYALRTASAYRVRGENIDKSSFGMIRWIMHRRARRIFLTR